ncbi:MAG: hypothetical protein ACLQIB_07270, partial [Isosphaeraceae bacterium]
MLLPDAFNETVGGFVGRVLGNEAALERPFQDSLSQPCGSLQVRVYLNLDLVDHREAAVDLLND